MKVTDLVPESMQRADSAEELSKGPSQRTLSGKVSTISTSGSPTHRNGSDSSPDSQEGDSQAPTADLSPAVTESTAQTAGEQPPPPRQLSVEEQQVLEQLGMATDSKRMWMHKNMLAWHQLPQGDFTPGDQLLTLAEDISSVYPWVFCLSFAVRHLTKDLKEQVAVARSHWPKGAVSCREAIRAEKASIGVPAIERKYWDTCTVRILWVYRALRILDFTLEDLAYSCNTPVESAQQSVDRVLGPYLNLALKKIADFIIWMCVYGRRSTLFSNIGISEAEGKQCFGLFKSMLRPHADAMEAMLKEEVPSVWAKKPP
eukprot:TRINITY_DN102676_c0_g1_i1.p1 TRINITY_DN102676_c0_g1~~TRINITY_DN102676_c0_g1_i1.p1  ORF type:complete len:364 (+),score=68.77 TRINITY_DN102676_c0_g1_i1:148-1092(+)